MCPTKDQENSTDKFHDMIYRVYNFLQQRFFQAQNWGIEQTETFHQSFSLIN